MNSQLFGIFFKTNVAQSVAELVLYNKKTRNVVISYQIWLTTKLQEFKQHFHDKTEFYLKTLSATHTRLASLGLLWKCICHLGSTLHFIT